MKGLFYYQDQFLPLQCADRDIILRVGAPLGHFNSTVLLVMAQPSSCWPESQLLCFPWQWEMWLSLLLCACGQRKLSVVTSRHRFQPLCQKRQEQGRWQSELTTLRCQICAGDSNTNLLNIRLEALAGINLIPCC